MSEVKSYRSKIWALVSVIFVVGASATGARADTMIDTTPSWNGTAYVYPFGPSNTETYGETITAPTDGDTVLNSFTFYINDDFYDTPEPMQLQGEVYAWNGSEASGSALWQGALETLPASSSFQSVEFDTGGVSVAPGSQYVIFATTSNASQSNPFGSNYNGWSDWGLINGSSSAAPGSQFVYLNNGTDTSAWTSDAWGSGFGTLAFKADFVGAAAPAPPILGATASLLGLLAYMNNKRRLASGK